MTRRTTRRTTRARRTRRAVALLVGVLVLAVGLGAVAFTLDRDTDDASSPTDPESGSGPGSPAAEPETPPDTWPLTGRPVAEGETSSLPHPVIVLKMDNTSSSAPQEGLGRADMVVEELVEGGLTRLAAFFYKKIPGEVGPVRSMRASDIGIVTPVDASVVTSGAASITIERIRKAGIQYFNEGSKGFFRDSSRYAPYNLFTNLRQTASLTTRAAARPKDYLPWGHGTGLPEGQPASSLVARFGSGHATEWTYRGGRYVNDNSYAAEDDRFRPQTVLALHVRIGDAGYTDPAGYPVPETELTGTGDAEIFHDGRRIKAQWTKAGPSAAITLTKRGEPIAVPAGKTWIELVPSEAGDVTFQP